MAVIRLSQTGKSIQFIDNDGTMFITSVSFIQKLILNQVNTPFVVLSQMPEKVAANRFPQSPIWDPEKQMFGVIKSVTETEGHISTTNDALSNNKLKKKDGLVKDVIL